MFDVQRLEFETENGHLQPDTSDSFNLQLKEAEA